MPSKDDLRISAPAGVVMEYRRRAKENGVHVRDYLEPLLDADQRATNLGSTVDYLSDLTARLRYDHARLKCRPLWRHALEAASDHPMVAGISLCLAAWCIGSGAAAAQFVINAYLGG